MSLRPEQSPGFLLWHTTLRWQREVATALKPFDLTHVQFVLLACAWWCDKNNEVVNQSRLAHDSGVDVRSTSEVLRRLEAKGLLERGTDSEDTRAKVVTITAKGRTLAPKAVHAVEKVDAEFFSVSRNQAQLLETLSKLSGR